MSNQEIIQHLDSFIKDTENNSRAVLMQAKEFVKIYIGQENSFLAALDKINSAGMYTDVRQSVQTVLHSLKNYAEKGLLRSMSVNREIQIETVSDYLDQAEKLLNDNKVHPAAAAVIIGASLEEFLRNWLEDEKIDLTKIKNGLDSYTKELNSLGKINKQDLKDITSWAGTRNDAAHGHWQNVDDRNRIKLMLEGVNLFMRKNSTIN